MHLLAPAVAFVDLETTGTSATGDRVTEVAIVRVVEGELVEEWSTLVDPERSIPPDIQVLTGITNDMVRGAPTFADIRREVRERLEGHLFVAHNARFDYGFLKNEFARLEMAFTADVLCTVRLSRRLYPEAVGHGLDALIARHGLADPLDAMDPTARTGRHSALGDARALWRFVNVIARERPPEEIAAAVKRLLKIPSLPPQLAADALEGVPDCPGVYRFFGVNDLPLYIGKSVNLRDRRALALHLRLPELERPSPLGRDPAPGLDRDRGGAGRAAAGIAPREGGGAAAQRAAAPPPHQLRDPPAVASRGAGDREDRRHRLGRARPRRRAPLRPLRLAARRARPASSRSPPRRACAGASWAGRSAAGPASRGRCASAAARAWARSRPRSHNLRLATALQARRIPDWPFAGPVAIVERDAARGVEEAHVVDRWRHLGTARDEGELEALAATRRLPEFDPDILKVLRRWIDEHPGRARAIGAPD